MEYLVKSKSLSFKVLPQLRNKSSLIKVYYNYNELNSLLENNVQVVIWLFD